MQQLDNRHLLLFLGIMSSLQDGSEVVLEIGALEITYQKETNQE